MPVSLLARIAVSEEEVTAIKERTEQLQIAAPSPTIMAKPRGAKKKSTVEIDRVT